MIDLHSHLLPGVDDGAIDNDSAIKLVQVAINDGITHLTLTPHVQAGRYHNTLTTLQKKFDHFQKLLTTMHLPISLSLGGEVRLDSNIIDLYTSKDLPFIGQWQGKNLMLLELPHEGIPIGSEKLVD